MIRQMLGGARTAMTYAALGALCAVTSLAGASAASWGGPPAQLEVDTASVLRASYAAGSTLPLPALAPALIDSARQDAATARPDLDGAAATSLVRAPSASDHPSDTVAPSEAPESTPELVLVPALLDDGTAHAVSPTAAPSRVTAVTEVAPTAAIEATTAKPARDPRAADLLPTPAAAVPAPTALPLKETPALTEALNPVLQPVVDLLASPLEPLAPLVDDTLTPLLDDTRVPVLDDALAPLVDDTLVPLVDDTLTPLLEGLLGGLFH